MGIMHIRNLTDLHRRLTAVLPLAGSRQLSDGPTAAELALIAQWQLDLEPALVEAYNYPLRNGIDAVPDTDDPAELNAWMIGQYEQEEPETAVPLLLAVLLLFYPRAFGLGGTLAFEEMGVAASFNLTNESIIDDLRGQARALTLIGSDISLTRTTANDLSRLLMRLRIEELSEGEIVQAIDDYIRARSLTRSGVIANHETVTQTRAGMMETFSRNGIERVFYRTAPELSETGPCPICEPFDGRIYNIIGGSVAAGPGLPQHTLCVCYYEPDLTDWNPEEVWAGE